MHGLKRKLNDLDFIELVKKYDILLFSETWLSGADNSNFDIQGYTCDHIFGNKSVGTKKGRYSGGLSIYYKNCFKDKIKIVEKNQCGILWVKIQSDLFRFEEDVYICNLYIPPSSSKVLNNQETDIYEFLEQGVLKYTERKKKRRVNFIPKFHSSLKKFVKYFTMITKRYMYGTKVPNFIGL